MIPGFQHKVTNAVRWLRETKIGTSFLLAVASWLVLVPAWSFTQEGSFAFRLIAAILRRGTSLASI